MVATTTVIGDWVRQVGGEAVSVDQVLEPNTDPHEYEPRPSDIEAAAGAGLVFANGDGLDSWIDEVVSDSGSGAEVVDLGAAVPDRLPGEDEGDEASRYDPHWWHDPRNAEAAVAEIERRLSRRRALQAPPLRSATPMRYLGRAAARSTGGIARLHRRGAAPPGASWSPTTTPSATSPTATGSTSSAR